LSERILTGFETASMPARADATARWSAAEERAMSEAIRCAKKGRKSPHPNPRVGAVVLRRGEIVARGHHERAGAPHAETAALDAAGEAARGATLVVTLEPCCHVGRTPPCTDAILKSGIRRVVVGMIDPNPLVHGRGAARLREAGVEVAVGAREEECRALNPAYLKWRATGLPRVTLKSMVSLDGRVATASGESRGLGGPEEQRLVHRLRAESDAVLIGVGTALRDDPLLTVRLVSSLAPKNEPWRVVLDSSLRTPLDSRLIQSAHEAPLVMATTQRAAARVPEYESLGVTVWTFEEDASGRVPLQPLLGRLAEEGKLELLVEGGPTVHTSFLRGGLADQVALGIAPILLGGTAKTWTGDLGRSALADGIEVGPLELRRLGKDVWLTGPIPARHGGPHV
jgi:diaminohydroxyphosphoribosylaminopyrimidine deaminase/5-amino-6-(5-phosphoribosylamino)uracil reductase